jgi:hypothetical protein
MIRKAVALWLLAAVAKLTGTELPVVDDETDPEAFDENEPDSVALEVAGPVAFQTDWEGDVVVSVLDGQTPRDELAGWLFCRHYINTVRGQRETWVA